MVPLVHSLGEVALGKRSASLVIRGGQLVNVLTREVYQADVAVLGDRIAAVGDVADMIGPETVVVEAAGKYLTPGLIDQHIHIHETHLNVAEFARAVLPCGTTAVCSDFYGECVVGGIEAARACLDASRLLPLSVFFVLPTPGYYQGTGTPGVLPLGEPFGHSGRPTRDEMFAMLDWPECHGMDDAFATKIVAGDPQILELVDAVQARGKKVCGHGSEVLGRPLQAWIGRVRATDDHESVNAAEAVEKARMGLRISMRGGSGCFDVTAVVKAVTEHGLDPRRFCFCTDLISPLQIADHGHIDHALRSAIRAGLPPVVAIQMATLNAAECLNVDDDFGSVSPGKVANILLVDGLAEFRVAAVVAKGELVARDGVLLKELPSVEWPAIAYDSVKLPRPQRAEDFAIRVGEAVPAVTVRVIAASGETLLTRELHERVPVSDGEVRADVQRDLLKIAAVERINGTGQIGLGLVHGFGLRSGAFATSYNSQQQNVIVMGTNDADMALAVNTLAQSGGGLIVVDQGEVKALLELPLFGLESDQPYPLVVQRLRELDAALQAQGCSLPAHFHTLGFMGMANEIGTLKISTLGLSDVWKGAIVDVVVS